MPVSAAAVLFFAILLSWHSTGEYLRNRSEINTLRERAATLEKALPDDLKKSLSAGLESHKELKRDMELVNDFAYRKSFSWTGLLSSLEEVLPDDVRLLQISPEFKSGKVRLVGQTRSMESALATVDSLGRAGFRDVFLLKHSKDSKAGHIVFDITAVYRPVQL